MSEPTPSEPAEFQEALAYQEAEEEVQIWIGSYSSRMFLPALVVGVPLTLALFGLARYSDPDNEGGFVRYGIEGIVVVGWVILLGLACYRVLGTEFMLTNKRLYCRRGFGHPGLSGIDLHNFLEVRVQQSALARFLGAGNIILTMKREVGLSCKLAEISDPERVASLIRKQLRAIQKSES